MTSEHDVGAALKTAAAALRQATDAALRPHGLTAPQYACLEQLARHPGRSSADLARGASVTRQSMHAVLQGLEALGLVTRPGTAPRGRELPAGLTAAGAARLQEAGVAAGDVERRLRAGLTPERQRDLLAALAVCARTMTMGVDATTDGCQSGSMSDIGDDRAAFRRLNEVRAEALHHARLARQLSAERRGMIQDLIDNGHSQADIAREMGVTRQAVQKMLAA